MLSNSNWYKMPYQLIFKENEYRLKLSFGGLLVSTFEGEYQLRDTSQR